MGVYAKKYHELGYDVLMPSLNGHADSEAGYVTMGWEDRLDVIDWINFIVENNPDVKIIIHGVSMGAATTMMATGEELPENVKVAVADCGFTSVWDIFSNKITNSFKMHEFPMLYSANTVNKLYSGFDFKEASSIEQLKNQKHQPFSCTVKKISLYLIKCLIKFMRLLLVKKKKSQFQMPHMHEMLVLTLNFIGIQF